MTLSKQDSGRTVEMTVGEIVTVRLVENPTTGYRWVEESVPGLKIEKQSGSSKTSEPLGKPSTREFMITPERAGSYTLHLEHKRTWSDEEPLEEFELRIVVK